MNNTFDTFDGCHSDAMAKVVLKNVEAFMEDGKPYLHLVYVVENSKEIYTVTVPKAELPIPTDMLTINRDSDYPYEGSVNQPAWIGLERSYLTLHPDKSFRKTIRKVIKTKTRKMTIAEIEKELGYSIEIVK